MDCRKPSSGFIDNIHEDLVEPDGLKVIIIVTILVIILQKHHYCHIVILIILPSKGLVSQARAL